MKNSLIIYILSTLLIADFSLATNPDPFFAKPDPTRQINLTDENTELEEIEFNKNNGSASQTSNSSNKAQKVGRKKGKIRKIASIISLYSVSLALSSTTLSIFSKFDLPDVSYSNFSGKLIEVDTADNLKAKAAISANDLPIIPASRLSKEDFEVLAALTSNFEHGFTHPGIFQSPITPSEDGLYQYSIYAVKKGSDINFHVDLSKLNESSSPILIKKMVFKKDEVSIFKEPEGFLAENRNGEVFSKKLQVLDYHFDDSYYELSFEGLGETVELHHMNSPYTSMQKKFQDNYFEIVKDPKNDDRFNSWELDWLKFDVVYPGETKPYLTHQDLLLKLDSLNPSYDASRSSGAITRVLEKSDIENDKWKNLKEGTKLESRIIIGKQTQRKYINITFTANKDPIAKDHKVEFVLPVEDLKDSNFSRLFIKNKNSWLRFYNSDFDTSRDQISFSIYYEGSIMHYEMPLPDYQLFSADKR